MPLGTRASACHANCIYAARPCQRCVKKGIADSCTEGHRKKAKYLLDDEELENLKRNKQDGSKDSGDNTLGSLSLSEPHVTLER